MQSETFVLDDPTTVDAYDELTELAMATLGPDQYRCPLGTVHTYHRLPDSFEWADDGAVSF